MAGCGDARPRFLWGQTSTLTQTPQGYGRDRGRVRAGPEWKKRLTVACQENEERMKLNAIANRTFWLMLGWLVVAMPANAFHDPSLGRWLNRDPIGESGFEKLRKNIPTIMGDGISLYLFCHNDPKNRIDAFGLEERTEDDCQKACFKFCKRSPFPSKCLTDCFNGCAEDPNYVPPILTPPPLRPGPKGCIKDILQWLWDHRNYPRGPNSPPVYT